MKEQIIWTFIGLAFYSDIYGVSGTLGQKKNKIHTLL